jgi:hypothetical protein
MSTTDEVFAALASPVAVPARTSFRVAEVWSLSSSPRGTVYVSDRLGAARVYLRAAPLAAGAAEIDLGPAPEGPRSQPLIVADLITIPEEGAHVGGVAAVTWSRVTAPSQRTSLVLRPTEVYLTNGGNSVLVYDTDGTRSLRRRSQGGQLRGALSASLQRVRSTGRGPRAL